ncbi:hypothetical protein AAIH52_35565, partial [Pseudomonas aeruginosa]
GEAGRIELGVVGTAMWGRMRPVMRRFLRENPNVEVLFREKMPACVSTTQLFIRHSRSVVLTHAGKILMEESRRLLVNANNVLARVEQIGRLANR